MARGSRGPVAPPRRGAARRAGSGSRRGSVQGTTSAGVMNAAGIREGIAQGKTSAVEVCRRSLDRIDAAAALHAFQHVDRDGALARATDLDAPRQELTRAPLAGVPIALKDNMCTTGAPTTACSRILEGYRPPYDATVVRRLRDAGAVIVGKTVCDEFAMGSSTENSAFGGTKNPWALDRNPGGSSGGSAAAVAAGLVPIALGCDAGGSIRQTAAFDRAIDTFRGAGAIVADVELPHASLAIPVYYLIATAEASSNLARYDGVRYGLRAPADTLTDMYERSRGRGFGPEVKRRIMLGTYVLSAGYYDAYYLKAQQVRTLIRRDYDRAFDRVDLVAMPTSPTPAFPLGERVADPLSMYLADVFTVAANLAGLPGISVTCGFSAARLPIGLQLMGRAFDESTVLRAADAYERETAWSRERPPHYWS